MAKVMVYNPKGGVTKSSIVEYGVRYKKYYGAEFDTNGVLSSIFEKDGKGHLIEYVDIERDFVVPDEKYFMFDMGGYEDYRLPYLLSQADILVVPYTIDERDVMVTLMMIRDLFSMHEKGKIDLTLIPIIFVPSLFDAKKKSIVKMVEDSMQTIFDMVPDILQVDFFPLPLTHAMVLSRKNRCSIWELVKEPRKYGLVQGSCYEADAIRYDEFFKKIGMYL